MQRTNVATYYVYMLCVCKCALKSISSGDVSYALVKKGLFEHDIFVLSGYASRNFALKDFFFYLAFIFPNNKENCNNNG